MIGFLQDAPGSTIDDSLDLMREIENRDARSKAVLPSYVFLFDGISLVDVAWFAWLCDPLAQAIELTQGSPKYLILFQFLFRSDFMGFIGSPNFFRDFPGLGPA